jgi:hypothetical protein|tara:strand:- start:2159 stop:2308 length:150 start_codon:yes stop_codon:yes gene_type:complete
MKYVIGILVGLVVAYNFPEIIANINPLDWFVDSGLRDKTINVLEGVNKQ